MNPITERLKIQAEQFQLTFGTKPPYFILSAQDYRHLCRQLKRQEITHFDGTPIKISQPRPIYIHPEPPEPTWEKPM